MSLIEQLRNPGVSQRAEYVSLGKLCGEAANRIEKLETALRTIVDNYSLKGGNPAQDGAIARAALKD